MPVPPIIPPEWGWAYDIAVGQDWPQADEDALRRVAQGWTDAMEALLTVANGGNAAAQNVNYSVQSVSSDEFNNYWSTYVDGDNSVVGQMAQQCENLATQCLAFAEQTEFTKLSIDIQLILLFIQLAIDIVLAFVTFGASTSEGVLAAFITRLTVRGFLTELLKAVLMAVLPDVITQVVMLSEGHRSSFDVGETLQAAQMGVIGGLVGAGLGAGLGKLGTTDFFDSVAGKFLSEDAGKFAGGVTNAALHGALTNVGTNMAAGTVDSVENQIHAAVDPVYAQELAQETQDQGYADQKSGENPLIAALNGAFTGALFHTVHEGSFALAGNAFGAMPLTLTDSEGSTQRLTALPLRDGGDGGYALFDQSNQFIGKGTVDDNGAFTITPNKGASYDMRVVTLGDRQFPPPDTPAATPDVPTELASSAPTEQPPVPITDRPAPEQLVTPTDHVVVAPGQPAAQSPQRQLTPVASESAPVTPQADPAVATPLPVGEHPPPVQTPVGGQPAEPGATELSAVQPQDAYPVHARFEQDAGGSSQTRPPNRVTRPLAEAAPGEPFRLTAPAGHFEGFSVTPDGVQHLETTPLMAYPEVFADLRDITPAHWAAWLTDLVGCMTLRDPDTGAHTEWLLALHQSDDGWRPVIYRGDLFSVRLPEDTIALIHSHIIGSPEGQVPSAGDWLSVRSTGLSHSYVLTYSASDAQAGENRMRILRVGYEGPPADGPLGQEVFPRDLRVPELANDFRFSRQRAERAYEAIAAGGDVARRAAGELDAASRGIGAIFGRPPVPEGLDTLRACLARVAANVDNPAQAEAALAELGQFTNPDQRLGPQARQELRAALSHAQAAFYSAGEHTRVSLMRDDPVARGRAEDVFNYVRSLRFGTSGGPVVDLAMAEDRAVDAAGLTGVSRYSDALAEFTANVVGRASLELPDTPQLQRLRAELSGGEPPGVVASRLITDVRAHNFDSLDPGEQARYHALLHLLDAWHGYLTQDTSRQIRDAQIRAWVPEADHFLVELFDGERASLMRADRAGAGWVFSSPDGNGELLRQMASAVPPGESAVNLFGHADAEGVLIGRTRVPLTELGAKLLDYPAGSTIRLYGCEAGAGPGISELARAAGWDVVAADTAVWIDRQGNVIASSEMDVNGRPAPFIGPDGQGDGTWRIFRRDGSSEPITTGDPRHPGVFTHAGASDEFLRLAPLAERGIWREGDHPSARALTELFGMPARNQRLIQELVDRYKLAIDLRPSNPESAGWLEQGGVPKPEAIKAKTINAYDVLLAPDEATREALAANVGAVGFFRPAEPVGALVLDDSGQPDHPQLLRTADLEPVWGALQKRYASLMREYEANAEALAHLEDDGFFHVVNGVVYPYRAEIVNRLDVELAPDDQVRAVLEASLRTPAYFLPAEPVRTPQLDENGDPTHPQLVRSGESQGEWAALQKRYAQRMAEYLRVTDPSTGLVATGKATVADGVVRPLALDPLPVNESAHAAPAVDPMLGPPVTGDHDMLNIRGLNDLQLPRLLTVTDTGTGASIRMFEFRDAKGGLSWRAVAPEGTALKVTDFDTGQWRLMSEIVDSLGNRSLQDYQPNPDVWFEQLANEPGREKWDIPPMPAESGELISGGMGIMHGATAYWTPRTDQEIRIYGDIMGEYGRGADLLIRFQADQPPTLVHSDTPVISGRIEAPDIAGLIEGPRHNPIIEALTGHADQRPGARNNCLIIGGDPELARGAQAAAQVQADGAFLIKAHGRGGELFLSQDSREAVGFDPAFLQMLTEAGWRPGQPIVLASCEAGLDGGAADKLAAMLPGTTVIAADTTVWDDRQGGLFAASETVVDGMPRPRLVASENGDYLPDGVWREHRARAETSPLPASDPRVPSPPARLDPNVDYAELRGLRDFGYKGDQFGPRAPDSPLAKIVDAVARHDDAAAIAPDPDRAGQWLLDPRVQPSLLMSTDPRRDELNVALRAYARELLDTTAADDSFTRFLADRKANADALTNTLLKEKLGQSAPARIEEAESQIAAAEASIQALAPDAARLPGLEAEYKRLSDGLERTRAALARAKAEGAPPGDLNADLEKLDNERRAVSRDMVDIRRRLDAADGALKGWETRLKRAQTNLAAAAKAAQAAPIRVDGMLAQTAAMQQNPDLGGQSVSGVERMLVHSIPVDIMWRKGGSPAGAVVGFAGGDGDYPSIRARLMDARGQLEGFDQRYAKAIVDLATRPAREAQIPASLRALAEDLYGGAGPVTAFTDNPDRWSTASRIGTFFRDAAATAVLQVAVEGARNPTALVTNLMTWHMVEDGTVPLDRALGYLNVMGPVGSAQAGRASQVFSGPIEGSATAIDRSGTTTATAITQELATQEGVRALMREFPSVFDANGEPLTRQQDLIRVLSHLHVGQRVAEMEMRQRQIVALYAATKSGEVIAEDADGVTALNNFLYGGNERERPGKAIAQLMAELRMRLGW